MRHTWNVIVTIVVLIMVTAIALICGDQRVTASSKPARARSIATLSPALFDSSFHAATIPGSFRDPDLPAGFAPFGIQNIEGTIYLTYALQDEDQEDDLNSPWGLALAPDDFGRFSGDLLVGNFGDGRIHAFDPTQLTATSEFEAVGLLHSASGRP